MDEDIKLNNLHKLNSGWTLWAHLHHDIDWSIKSYKKMNKVNSIEEIVVLINTLPEKMVKNCMLFFMREAIKPM